MNPALTNVLQLFRNKSFLFFWLSHALTSIDTAVRSIALVWLVMDLTGHASSLNLVLICFSVPRVLFLLFSGVLTDRYDSKKILGISYSASAALTFVIVGLGWSHLLQISVLALLLFFLGISDGIAMPAIRSIIPRIVPISHLQQANSVDQFVPQLSMIVGSSAVGFLVAQFGAIPVFLILAIVYVISAVFVLLITSEKAATGSVLSIREFFRDINEGVRYIYHSRWMPGLFLLDTLGNFAFAGLFTIVLPLWARAHAEFGSSGLGLLITGFGVGSLLGVVLAGVYRPKRIGLVFCAIECLQGLLLLFFPFVPLLTAMTLWLLIGLFSGASGLLFVNLLSERTDSKFLGRIMSFMMLAILGLQPISQLIAGLLIAKYASEVLFVGSALLMIFGSLIIATVPAIHGLRSTPNGDRLIE